MYKIIMLVAVTFACLITSSSSADVMCSLGRNVVMVKKATRCPKGYSAVSINSIKNASPVVGPQGPVGPQGVQGVAGSFNSKFCYTKKSAIPLSQYPEVKRIYPDITPLHMNPDWSTAKFFSVRNVTISCDKQDDIMLAADVDLNFKRSVTDSMTLYTTLEGSNCAAAGSSTAEKCTQKIPNGYVSYLSDKDPALSSSVDMLKIVCCASK